MPQVSVERAFALALSFIVVLVVALFTVSYFVTSLLGLPPSLGLPPAARAFGAVVVLAGLAVAGWLVRYRGTRAIVVSTYVTFSKMFGRSPLSERGSRTEPLVVGGPQKYLRHPLYFGVIVMALGWAVLSSYTFVLLGTIIMLPWFRFVVVPFEEKELLALFGEEYAAYSRVTPMLVPFTKRRHRPG